MCLSASPISMSFSELFTALQQKNVDGQDNGLILSMDSKFNEVQGYYTDLGHVQDTSVIFISEDFWKSLPEDLQRSFSRRPTRLWRKSARIMRTSWIPTSKR